MRFTLRAKLALLVVLAVVTIGCMILVGEWVALQHRADIDDLEMRLVPRVELAPKLKSGFTDLTRAFQDAVAAQELEALDRASRSRDQILQLIAETGPALSPTASAALRWKIQDYYESALTVSRVLITGESDERSDQAVVEMQRRQREAEATIQQVAFVDRADLGNAFSSLQNSNLQSSRFGMTVGVVGLLLLAGVGGWVSRQMVHGLGVLSEGLSRFSTGDFEKVLVLTSNDELKDLSRDANSMAAKLQQLAADRDAEDFLKSAQVHLAGELVGNLTREVIATRTAKCLVDRTKALAAAVFLLEADGQLQLAGQVGCCSERAALRKRSLSPGEGLLGQAFSSGELTVHTELPPGYFPIESGLGGSAAPALALLPITRGEDTLGVVELAFPGRPSEASQELLLSVRHILHVNLEAAGARASLNELLKQTRQQAERLAAQEEELRLSNQELVAQRDELGKANSELEEQQMALSERNRDLDLARERIQEKVVELSQVSLYKSQFLANMSHELRTPLNSMLLLSHLLAENEAKTLTEKQVSHCRTIHSAGEDLLNLINQVLDLAKIEAGKEEVHFESVIMAHVLETMRGMFEPLANEKKLLLSTRIEQGTPESFWVDRHRLERVLTNLLGNAIKFTEKGSVELVVGPASGYTPAEGQSDSWVQFSVRDTGIGIAPKEKERAFVPFEQIESSSSRRYQGTGLGLAIVRESVKLMGGEMRLESELGRGSTFTCLLPRGTPQSGRESRPAERESRPAERESRPAERESRPAERESRPAERESRPAKNEESHEVFEQEVGAERLHVLVIEDDPFLGEQLLEIVHGRGLEGALARTGAEGLQLAKSHLPRGIILDVKLPDIDGWTVLDRLQSDPKTRSIPVHFLSALDAPEGAMKRGAIGYLTKPASSEELTALVQSLAQTTTAQSQRVLVVEDSADEGRSILALLESEGVQARHVTSARGALAAVSCEPFGCIILDIGLEDMDGLDFLTELSERPDSGSLSVIVHTGRSLTHAEVAQLEKHAQAIVMKDGNSSVRLLEEVRLFVHHVRDRLSRKEAPSRSVSEADAAKLQGFRVLLIEDDMRTVYSLSALLQSRGCDVIVAENGREALDLLSETLDPIHCVITDIMMPVMDGYETMKHLRTQERFRDVPIIALTARAAAGERRRCLSSGASDYLSKPVDGAALMAVLSSALGQSS